MNKIYVFAVKTGRSSYGYIRDADPEGDTIGFAMNSDKEVIASHYSSGIEWTRHDMGITSNWQHNIYKALYPDGYDLVWLGLFKDVREATEKIRELRGEQ